MEKESFSRRFGIRPRPQQLQYQEVSYAVRVGFTGLVFDLAERLSLSASQVEWEFYHACEKVTRRRLPPNPMGGPSYHIDKTIEECKWYEFYDLCEEVYRILCKEVYYIPISGGMALDLASEFATRLNELLKEEGMGYEIRDGAIERVGSTYTDAIIEKARVLLREHQFVGPDQQFERAIRYLNTRPEPDLENCVKDAVGALEGIARIVTGDEKSTLGELLDKKLAPLIPKPLHKAFEAVYGYRSTTPGIGHGQVGPSTVTVEDAELVLNLCAAMILYLAKKK